jgi:hypothetical protein
VLLSLVVGLVGVLGEEVEGRGCSFHNMMMRRWRKSMSLIAVAAAVVVAECKSRSRSAVPEEVVAEQCSRHHCTTTGTMVTVLEGAEQSGKHTPLALAQEACT